ncbi:MAG: hypothetical protein J6K39_00405 [Clostridia bacterium]|nr:hypothetical protein [Clostridia bacterium]
MDKRFNFKNYIKNRQNFLKQHKDEDFVILDGEGCVMLSAPHGVSQARLGEYKVAEPGSLAFMLELGNRTGAHCIAKTKDCNDDANFDEISTYKEGLKRYIRENNIKFLFDIHGLSKKRGIDINFGTHMGQNIKTNERLFDELTKKLGDAGFFVTIDNPFSGDVRTVAGSIAKELGIWTIQVEISFQYTNENKHSEKLQEMLRIFEEIVEVTKKF